MSYKFKCAQKKRTFISNNRKVIIFFIIEPFFPGAKILFSDFTLVNKHIINEIGARLGKNKQYFNDLLEMQS